MRCSLPTLKLSNPPKVTMNVTPWNLMEFFDNLTKHLELAEKVLVETYNDSGGQHSENYPRAELIPATLVGIRVAAWISSALHGAFEETGFGEDSDE